jgi:hypothetical protein
MISSESHNGRVRCDREKGFSYEGNARSVMLIGGPVNTYLNQLMIVKRSPLVTGKTS